MPTRACGGRGEKRGSGGTAGVTATTAARHDRPPSAPECADTADTGRTAGVATQAWAAPKVGRSASSARESWRLEFGLRGAAAGEEVAVTGVAWPRGLPASRLSIHLPAHCPPRPAIRGSIITRDRQCATRDAPRRPASVGPRGVPRTTPRPAPPWACRAAEQAHLAADSHPEVLGPIAPAPPRPVASSTQNAAATLLATSYFIQSTAKSVLMPRIFFIFFPP